MSPRTHAEIEELLGAYALDAVDPDEAALISAHLETCPRCRSEVSEHREVAAMLGNSGSAAPEGLWERIADSLEDTPPPLRMPDNPNVVPLRPARRGVGRGTVLALAAAAVVVVGLLGLLLLQSDSDPSGIPGIDEVAADANVARMSGDGALSAEAVLLSDGTGYLIVDGLPALEDDRAYQLWGITGDKVVSLGVLGHDPKDVMPFSAASDLDSVAITEEVAGGVPTSEQSPLLVGDFD